MFDQEYRIGHKEKGLIVSVTCPTLKTHETPEKTQTSIEEMQDLMMTLGIEYSEHFTQNRAHLDPGTIIGPGKLEEIAHFAKENKVTLLIFDLELTAGQLRKIKKLTDITVIDRCHIILEIFAKHATTRESKIQIEIARLQYLLPRLSGYWTHFSRQRGGVGVRGGEGEQQIELDRRIIRKRISQLKKELETVVKSREQQGKQRKKRVLTAALVGYTNVGKSSLMNALCQGNVLEENKLFATLDSTYRTLTPNTHPPLALIDTVGFLNNLPNTLIDGFRSTLDSAKEADLLIIVCDISSAHYNDQLDVTFDILKNLDIENKDYLIVFNKMDLNQDQFLPKLLKRRFPKSYFVSSKNQEEMNKLRQDIIHYILEQLGHFDLFIPYEDGAAHAKVLNSTNVIKTTNHEKGIFYRIRTPDFVFNQLGMKDYTLLPGHDYE